MSRGSNYAWLNELLNIRKGTNYSTGMVISFVLYAFLRCILIPTVFQAVPMETEERKEKTGAFIFRYLFS